MAGVGWRDGEKMQTIVTIKIFKNLKKEKPKREFFIKNVFKLKKKKANT